MNLNRPVLVLSLLLLFLFLSTSDGFANVSIIQEKLRDIQLKLIREQIKLIQERTFDVGREVNQERAMLPSPTPEPTISREELARGLENQIVSLQGVIESLRPRAIEEETVRIERRVAEINKEAENATGDRLLMLREELASLFESYRGLEKELVVELDKSIKAKQLVILQTKVRELREKVITLPRPTPVPPPAPPTEAPDIKVQVDVIRDRLQALQLKVLREQARFIQQKIDVLRGQ